MYSYGGKLSRHICKLEWFKNKQIWIDENVFISSQEPYRAVNSDRDHATLFCVQEKFPWPHAGIYRVHYFICWGWGDHEFWLYNVTSWGMYCIDVIQRIVTKSLCRTALPFFYTQCSNLTSALATTRITENICTSTWSMPVYRVQQMLTITITEL